jgi:hypothetical protein
MSNNRNLMILAVIVVALGVIYAMSSQRRPSLDTSGGFADLVEGTLSTDEVQSISVRRGGEGFTMVNGDGGWVIEDHFGAPANLNKIRTLLGNLESVTGELRSDDDGVLASYALDDSQAYHLKIDEAVDLMVGKRSGSGCFVREGGSSKVYATDHNFLSDFGVCRIDGDETVTLDKELAIAEPEEPVEGEVPAGWPGENYERRVNGDFVGSRTRGDAVISSLVSIRAGDVLGRGENPEGSGLDDPDRITVTLEGATELTLLFGGAVADMSGQVWFRVEGRELLWAVPEFVKGNLFKTADELRAE